MRVQCTMIINSMAAAMIRNRDNREAIMDELRRYLVAAANLPDRFLWPIAVEDANGSVDSAVCRPAIIPSNPEITMSSCMYEYMNNSSSS